MPFAWGSEVTMSCGGIEPKVILVNGARELLWLMKQLVEY